MAEDLEMMVVT